MRAIQIALKDVKTVGRDYKALAIILAMPVILIVILGAALGGMFSGTAMNPIKVAVADLDGGMVSEEFIHVLAHESIVGLIDVVEVRSEDEGTDLLKAGSVAVVVVIPKGVSDAGSPDTKSIRVVTDPGKAVSGQIVASIVRSFTEQYSAVAAAMKGLWPLLYNPGQGTPGDGAVPVVAPGLAEIVAEGIASETVRGGGLFSVTEEKPTWITARQYYTASMSVTFVLYGAMLGVKSIIEERSQHTMSRLFSTKATPGDIVVGKTLAAYLISFLQLLVLVAFTSAVYCTRWGDLRGVFLVTGSLALAATGFAMFIAAVGRTERMVDALSNFGVQAMAFLGGCQLPIYMFPPALNAVSKVTLNRWGLDGYLLLMEGQVWTAASKHAAVLAGMGLIYLILGIWRLRLE